MALIISDAMDVHYIPIRLKYLGLNIYIRESHSNNLVFSEYVKHFITLSPCNAFPMFVYYLPEFGFNKLTTFPKLSDENNID